MGQKVNPIGLRVGINRTWDSRWFAQGKDYANNLHEDYKLRRYLLEKLKHAAVSKIEMERAAKKIKVIISTARPGVVIGKKGTGIDSLKADVQKLTTNEIFINIQEIRKPDIDAQLVANSIAMQLEKSRKFRWSKAKRSNSLTENRVMGSRSARPRQRAPSIISGPPRGGYREAARSRSAAPAA